MMNNRKNYFQKIVSTLSKPKLAFPIILKLTEYRANCVKIPASKSGIPNFVCRVPVTSPATIPPAVAKRIASTGETPEAIYTAEIAPPRVKLPSTVKSA